MILKSVITVPIWEEPDGHRRPPLPGEVQTDLTLVGWANLLDIRDLDGEDYLLLHSGTYCL